MDVQKPDMQIMTLKIHDKIQGFIAYKREEDRGRQAMYFYEIQLADRPEIRRKRIGTKWMKMVKKAAENERLATVVLRTHRQNEDARGKFYSDGLDMTEWQGGERNGERYVEYAWTWDKNAREALDETPKPADDGKEDETQEGTREPQGGTFLISR